MVNQHYVQHLTDTKPTFQLNLSLLFLGVTIFLLILAGIQGRTQTNIHVDGLHNFTTINTDPELNIKYRFEANESLGIFKLKCSSIEPVEWVFDDLTVKVILIRIDVINCASKLLKKK